MSTIAFCDNMLASDFRVTGGYIMRTDYMKIACGLNRKGETIYGGGAGNFSSVEEYLIWIRGGKKPEFTSEDDFEGLMFNATTQRLYYMGMKMIPIEMEGPYAVGSGSDYAMGAMLAGKDAEQAVRIAAVLDPNTGGPVAVLDTTVLLKPKSRSKPKKRKT